MMTAIQRQMAEIRLLSQQQQHHLPTHVANSSASLGLCDITVSGSIGSRRSHSRPALLVRRFNRPVLLLLRQPCLQTTIQ